MFTTTPRTGAGRALRAAGLAALGLTWLGTATLSWASLIERNAFTLRHVELKALPAGSEPIRILQLADFHLLPWQRRKQRFVRSLAALQPDLIVNSGDNLGHENTLEELREMLEPFRGIPGVVVHGSNDFYAPIFKNPLSYLSRKPRKKRSAPKLDVESMDRMFRDDFGWIMLDNRAEDIVVKGVRMRWLGLGDPHIERDNTELALAHLMELDASAPTPDIRLGSVHAPYLGAVDSLIRHGCWLVFAGHTHGGQVCVPGYGAIITNCDLPAAKVKGLSEWSLGPGRDESRTALSWAKARPAREELMDGPGAEERLRAAHPAAGFLHVSGGLGTSPFAPFRLACRPEANLITLLPQDASQTK